MAKYRVSELMAMKGTAERMHDKLNNLKPNEGDKFCSSMLIEDDDVELIDEIIQTYISFLDELIGSATVSF